MSVMYVILIVLAILLFGLGTFFGFLQKRTFQTSQDLTCASAGAVDLEVLSFDDDKPNDSSETDSENDVVDEEIF